MWSSYIYQDHDVAEHVVDAQQSHHHTHGATPAPSKFEFVNYKIFELSKFDFEVSDRPRIDLRGPHHITALLHTARLVSTRGCPAKD